MSRSLTPPERETVVLMDDASGTARITSWQRRIVTKLDKNPAATLVERMRHGTSIGAVFEIPASLISFRSKTRKGTQTIGKGSKSVEHGFKPTLEPSEHGAGGES